MRPCILRRTVVAVVSLSVLPSALFAGEGAPPNAPSENAQPAGTGEYILGPADLVRQVYPDESWLPEPYKRYYPDLVETIELFTEDSLEHDGIEYDSVSVTLDEEPSRYRVTIRSSDPAARDYARVHPGFVDVYARALKGVAACKAQPGCWNRGASKDQPWAFFPQFTLPMANQESVLLLNYPPITALTEKSYLDTFTIERWSSVYRTVGIDDPTLYETIVDVHPIGAPAGTDSDDLPNAQTYFNDGQTGGYYITPALNLLLDPPSNGASGSTLPLVVLGGPARDQWHVMTGASEALLTTGRYTLPGASKGTPYILGNHPDVTTYQCCPGDPSSQCDSYDLIPDEQIDLTIACWVKRMSEDPDRDPESVEKECHHAWGRPVGELPEETQFKICVRARLDNDACFHDDVTPEEAAAYCKKYENNPCANYRCTVDSD